MASIFGDIRLDKRLEELTEQMSANPTANLPRIFKDWSSLKAGYRFMNNERVSHGQIIELERQASMERMQAEAGEVLLAVQDSTSFNFAKHQATHGLGVLDNNQSAGFFAHTTLAVSEKGVPLGILGQQVWSRPYNRTGKTNARKQKPIHEKESFKWLTGIRQLAPLCQRVVTVCDREADVYELFQDAKDRELDYIVRVDGNRRLEDAPLLRDYLREISASGRYSVRVQRQVNQASREAQVEVRYATVTLLPPERCYTLPISPS
jgi:hypothetical protein